MHIFEYIYRQYVSFEKHALNSTYNGDVYMAIEALAVQWYIATEKEANHQINSTCEFCFLIQFELIFNMMSRL